MVNKVLITGSNGFIGSNLLYSLKNNKKIIIYEHNRGDNKDVLIRNIKLCDTIIHLACINRPKKNQSFKDNLILTKTICENINSNKKTKIIFASTYHLDSSKKKSLLLKEYCKIKKNEEEKIIKEFSNYNNKYYIFRLPNVVGKWCKPNYNSVVSTFCHNILNNKKSKIINKNNILNIVSIDSVIDNFQQIINNNIKSGIKYIKPNYRISVQKLYNKISEFKTLSSDYKHGIIQEGLEKILYSVFISHLPSKKITVNLNNKFDSRGSFFELLKTQNSGQLSFFTCKPGIERGGHFHHTKVEKFIIIKGKAEFKFTDIRTKRSFKIRVSANKPQIVYSKPGLFHKVKNIGKDELISILWSSEIYDEKKSDTYINYK